MEYYIIRKKEIINSEIINTEIGYLLSEEDKNTFNSIHKVTYDTWREDNIDDIVNNVLSDEDYLISNGVLYICTLVTNTLDGRESLTQIINLNTPE